MTPRKRLRGNDGKFISKASVFTLTAHEQHTDLRQESAYQAKPSASDQVLNTTELLEAILLEIPMRDLLLGQRVCKTWRSLTTTSLQLRRALFLEPVPCGDISYIDWRLDDKDFYTQSRANLGLGEHVRGVNRDQIPKTYPSHWGKSRDDAGRYRVFVNPLLTKMFPVLTKYGIHWQQQMQNPSPAMKHQAASWRSMYFTQPPVNCLAVEYDCAGEGDSRGDWSVTPVQKDPAVKGLTMVELFECLVMIGKPAWIEGRHMWEEYDVVEKLGSCA